MVPEVQYERLLPKQIVAAREACPVAYIPLGTLEWHGPHNPVGTDGVKIHALAMRCAQAAGGLVFPTMWYGESREEGLMEATGPEREGLANAMKLPPANFAPGYMRFTPREQIENYLRLLMHTLFQVQSLGFKVAVFVAGHYPLIDHAHAACCQFHQARFGNRRAQMITWAFTGYELVQKELPEAGDHAGFWETSLMLALVPGLSDLNELPADPQQRPVSVITSRPIRESSAEYGEKAVQMIVERATRQVLDRLKNPQAYYGHGLRF
jgi:creatinine amidohydrolase